MSQSGPQDADFPDRGPAVFAVTTATLALASLFVAARMVSRVGILRRTGWDDYIMILAWLFAVFLSLAINMGAMLGLGRHDRNIDPEYRAGLRICQYVFSVLYNPALMATKTSILIFYLRLAKDTQRILRLASWAVLGIVNVAGTILTFMNLFQCQPVRAAWDIDVASVQCIPLLTEFICSAPVNIVTDLAILALPIPVLTGMRLPPRQKTILVVTFALGIFVTIVDVVRIYYLQKAIDYVPMTASSDPMATYGQSTEFSWNASLSLMWSAVEVNAGIICACIPTLKPLMIRILPAMIVDPDGTRRSSSARNNQYASDRTKPSATEDTAATATATAQPPTLPVTPPDGRVSEEISMRDFLSGAAEGQHSTDRSSRLNPSVLLPAQRDSTSVYFGFVNMRRPKSMLKTSAAESLKYCTVVSILFFLWGFSYGLLNTLNNVVADVADMSTAQTLGLTSIYFGGGYFLGPLLVGEWLLRHDEHHRSRKKNREIDRDDGVDSVGGFKATFIAGLLIYGTGTIMFWPSAVLAAYGGFMASSFVVGFGLAVLETAANPFIALCGPPGYAHARLLVAQGVQAIGSVLSGLLANKVFFVRPDGGGDGHPGRVGVDSTMLIDVQWTYLAVTLLSVLLALFFYYMPLPEVADAELAELASTLPVDPEQTACRFGSRGRFSVSLRTSAILLAVFSQWTYVSAQENVSLFLTQLLSSSSSSSPSSPPYPLSLSIPSYLLLCHAAFALSRFLAAYLSYLHASSSSSSFSSSSLSRPSPLHHLSLLTTNPRTLLLACTTGAAACALAIAVLPSSSSSSPSTSASASSAPAAALLILLFFFLEGPVWPLTFSLGLRGQGSRAKRAAAWLAMAGSGPGVWPFVGYAILVDQHTGTGTGTGTGGNGNNNNNNNNNTNSRNVRAPLAGVVVALMVVAAVYPLWLCAVSAARGLVDPDPDPGLGRGTVSGRLSSSSLSGDVEGGSSGTLPGGNGGGGGEQGREMTPVKKAKSQQGQAHEQREPWEQQVLDTAILRD